MTHTPPVHPRGRDIHESHRVSTPLELLFDLTFVVALAQAAAQLHHSLTEEPVAFAVLHFLMAFFAIWWAWMNYTWFASAYDNDDTVFRLLTMLQMVGVLIFATGVPLIPRGDFVFGVLGYTVMRIAMVVQWLRAASGDPARRSTCHRYALGLTLVQLLWIARLWLPPAWQLPTFLLFAVLDMAVPAWAERRVETPWHAHHIAERHGLFTIIALGECVLGATNAVGNVLQSTAMSLDVALVGLGSASLVLAMWWMYFLMPSGEALHAHRSRSYLWSFGHFILFASIAAGGSGLELVADLLTHTGPAHGDAAHVAPAHHAVAHHASPLLVIGFLAGVLAVYMVLLWVLWRYITRGERRQVGALLAALGVLAAVVAGVANGLPVAWALPALTIAPALMIASHETGAQATKTGH